MESISSSSPTLTRGTAKRRGRPWFPIIITALGLGGIIYVQSLVEFERNLKSWLTAAIPLLVLILNFLWFVLTPRFTWRTRLIGVAVTAVVLFGLKHAVRVDGTVNGTGLPRIVWKWSAPSQPILKEIKTVVAETSVAAADPRLGQASEVPQFFGPHRDGIVTGAKLATDWQSQTPKQLWRQPIGLGWSAFAVSQGRAYTQEQRGEDELVTCYDLFTGKLIWAHADKAHFSQWQGGDGPRATPTVHEGRVYAYGATGLLNCVDAATGKAIWQHSVLAENKSDNIEWGVSCSPLIVDDKVIVSGGNTEGPVLFAYLRETGAPVWKAGNDHASYASPSLATLAGKQMILSNNAGALTGHDPATGKVILEHSWGVGKWPKASQPVVIDQDRVFISAGYGMGCQLLQIKAGTEGRLVANEIWSGMKMKTQFNSPSLRNGHLYGIDDGRMACVDVASGERLWKDGRYASGQSLLVDDLLIVQNESGTVHLLGAKPDGFKEHGKIEALSSKTWNHPVLSGRYLLVRNDREAVCYELPVQP